MSDETDPTGILGPEPDEPAKKVRKAKTEERLHPILTNDEVMAARMLARKSIDAERRAAAMKAIEAEETDRLRYEDGLTTGIGVQDELLDITIDLPPFTPCIMINHGRGGGVFWHGKTYHAVPRHIVDTLREQQWRAWRHEDAIDGKSITERLRIPRNTMINGRTGAVQNAPGRFDA